MQVLEKISALLHSPDPKAQREANAFLTNWQRTPEAWSESHAILNGSFPVETLRTKILYDFYQLPQDSHLNICKSMLSYLNKDDLSHSIASTVGLAVCDMAIQMAGSWETPVETFVNYYKSNLLGLERLLFLLEMLPEEAGSNRLILVPSDHDKFTFRLKTEYPKVVELLTMVRSNLTQASAELVTPAGSAGAGNVLNYKMLGKILKVWNNWRKFDTLTSSTSAGLSFKNDCLEIIKNPWLRSEGLEDATYETSVDCMVDLLEECAYLTNKSTYGHEEGDGKLDAGSYVTKERYQELADAQKACFNVLLRGMQPQLVEAFKTRDVFLYFNLSMLLVNLVDSVSIDPKSTDPDVLLLLDFLLKFVELPYLLLFSCTKISHLVNPFLPDYNRNTAREAVVGYLASLGGSSGLGGSNFSPSEGAEAPLYLDEELCNISQKSVLVLVDVLSKFHKILGNSLARLPTLGMLTAQAPGVFSHLVSGVLQTFLLVTLPPYQLYVSAANSGEMVNYAELHHDFNLYLEDLMEVYYELSRILPKDTLFEYFRANVLNSPNFSSNLVLFQSALVLLPPALLVTTQPSGQGQLSSGNDNVKVVEQLVAMTSVLFGNNFGLGDAPVDPENARQQVLVALAKIGAVKFLGQIKRVFALPDRQATLKEVLVLLMRQLSASATSSGTSVLRMEKELVDLQDKLRYESAHSVSALFYHLRMERLSNTEEVLMVIVSSMENVENELFVMILEGLAESCRNLNANDLMAVFNRLLGTTLNQLMSLVNSMSGSAMNPSSMSAKDKKLVAGLLSRIVAFVRNMKNRPDLDPVVGGQVFPVLLNLLPLFHTDSELVEAVCRCLKHSARVLDIQFARYVPSLVETVSTVARVKMFGTYLYLIEWLHSIFYVSSSSRTTSRDMGGLETRHEEILGLYNMLTALTLSLFKRALDTLDPSRAPGFKPGALLGSASGQDPGLDDEIELLVDDFYGLQNEFFLNSDNYLTDLSTVDEIIRCSCSFFFIKRPQCVFFFWESLLKASGCNPRIASLTTKYLELVVKNCFLVLAGGCERSVEYLVEDVLGSMLSFVRSNGFPVSALPGADLSNPSLTRDRYVQTLFSNALSLLPSEIIGNEKLRESFLKGLVDDTRSTVNHIYKLLSKLAMRNRT